MTLRIGNCSGFYGDRLSAMREMLTGGDLDVLTGDYLAELTMLILGRDRMKDPSLGYARTFVRQAEDCLGLALERGVRIVANAGGLNPAGLAERLREVAAGLGLRPSIGYVDGDDLLDRADELGLAGPGKPLTANAYLGGCGIAAALRSGADVVVTGRVTDASLVVGPAVAHYGWSPASYDVLAGAMVAGHVIECGTQACGGNFSGFRELGLDATPIGFPVAEIEADGSAVITKHAGTGGAVTVDTVTAQLLYEVETPLYLGPDVSARLDTIRLAQVGPDRVRISGVLGEPPPETLKVCVNELGGFRNEVELVLTGLDIDAKAAWVRAQLGAALAGRMPASMEWTLAGTDREDAATEEAASVRLRCIVKDADPNVVGRAFSAAAVELALASYPGFTLTAPPGAGTPYGIYRPAYVSRSAVHERVVVDGVEVPVDPRSPMVAASSGWTPPSEPESRGSDTRLAPSSLGPPSPTKPRRSSPAPPPVMRPPGTDVGDHPRGGGPTRRIPLGTFVHARSGDKGGDANLGLWVAHAQDHPARVAWLLDFVTEERVRELVPEAEGLAVEVYPLPNLGGVNVVLRGLLGQGVAASTRFDPQAKGLGEWVRSRHVEIPEALL